MGGCSILGCKSRSESRTKGITFHSFPFNPDIRRKWIEATGRKNWQPKKSSRICFVHFDKDMFLYKDKLTKLMRCAIPKIGVNLSHKPELKTSSTMSEDHSINESIHAHKQTITQSNSSTSKVLNPTNNHEVTEYIIARVYNYLQAEYEELKSSICTSCDLSPLANILKRTAAATGISEHTVSAILKKKRSADDEVDTGAAKRAKLTHDSPITDDESSSEASDKEQDDGNEETDDDSQEQDEYELKMEIKIEDENESFDPLQLQTSEMNSAVGHVISPASKSNSDNNTIIRESVQVKIEPDIAVDPQPKPRAVPTMTPVLQLRGSACEVTRVATLKLYTPPAVTPHSNAASTSDVVCKVKSEPDVP